MTFEQLLQLIQQTASRNVISTPWIVGGTPRDKILGRLNQIADLDITTGDTTITKLGQILHQKLPSADYRVMPDGHAQLIIEGLKVDLSSNFRVPGILSLLQKAGISNPTPMQCELYSRDFTCNALLLSLDLKRILDPTGLAIQDLKRKLIRTCLPASLTLGSQHKRIVRVIYLAAKLNFEVDPEIINWVGNHPSFLADANQKYLSEKLNTAAKADLNKTIRLISEMGLWRYVPPLPIFQPYLGNIARGY